MNETVREYLNGLEFLKPQVSGPMEVIPVRAPGGSLSYLTLSEAMEREVLWMGEVDESGSVPQVRAVNRSCEPVLLIDGEELEGGKQNRVINATVLLPEESETIIPVSCVEQARWSYTSKEFRDPGRVAALNVRLTKTRTVTENLEGMAGHIIDSGPEQTPEERAMEFYRSNQGMVWEEVNRLHRRTGTESGTGAMGDAYRKEEDKLNKFRKPFRPVKDQKGVLVAINGTIAGLEFVSRAEAYMRLHERIIGSYAIEAMLHDRVEHGPLNEGSFIEEIMGADEKSYPSPSYGTDHRYTSDHITGSALTHRGEVVHSVFFSLENDRLPCRAMEMMRSNHHISQNHQ
ncbi:unknown [Methanothermobacter thermautotrophicus str. Delta H]|uniref:ARG and Rhodanese-Phosphatase-superfamily-associated domain-containing protein n=1 Tax=Methanothermobacter thermautotrophicus (strain ATCC 29096 / DSM 1053 / JCM 10044 / NBRC 100330 / Delta H) TaxID=187420 RepID=O26612_METTH|nr:DUF6569 family protein [Methanothermobacter thermautotrophicus]AAB85018.1 unknown [Methanothermobacter thermautotrophicus str. Delta H]WBF06781.1 hypothetical protein ISG35_02375 [Methanothermobacter thermautotrophicus]